MSILTCDGAREPADENPTSADLGLVWMARHQAAPEAAIQFCHDHGIRVVAASAF